MKINRPMSGDERVIRKFLLFPMGAYTEGRGRYQIRWLERASIWQRYDNVLGWCNVSWIDE